MSLLASISSIYIGIDSWIDAAGLRPDLITRCAHAAIATYFDRASLWLTATDCDLAGSFGESSSIDNSVYRDRLLDRCSHSQIRADHSLYSCRYLPIFRVCVSMAHSKRLRSGRIVWRVQWHRSYPYISGSTLGSMQPLADYT